MSRAHADISPSGAEAIARCPGKVNATKDLPRRSNEAAAEGTVLHEINAECLVYGFDPYDFLGETHECEGFEFVIDEDQAESIVPGLDWVREQPGKLFVETPVDLSAWPPFEFGTLDVGIVAPDLITLVDHKFGYIPVEAESNKQIAIYAIGFYEQIAKHLTQATRFRLIINQPRRIGPKWREWIVELDELREFMGDIQEAMQRALDPDAPRIAGQVQCQYCLLNPALGGPGCDALESLMLGLLGLDHEALDDAYLLQGGLEMPDLSTLTPEMQATIWKHRTMLKNWIEGVTKVATERAAAGDPPPGLKAVPSFGDREYTDPEAAEAILVETLGVEESFTKKLKSPAQAEKVMMPTKRKPGHPEAWKKLDALIIKPEKGVELALMSDERKAVVPNELKFEEEEG